jgi:ABC-type antimicrobial peptide transport system permease subunit
MAASILGVLGLTLATIGMFGVFAYAVRQRTREIGIRMALGAHSGAIIRLVLSGNSRAVTIGVAAGLAGAIGASQVLRNSLYGLSPLDPIAYAGVVLLLVAAATAQLSTSAPGDTYRSHAGTSPRVAVTGSCRRV